ncbi:MAG TPA: CvpA family protein [Bryobacteraceae bacterium]|nr:CvpA family protein [Bryobacteraceae bacterium]
MNWLDAVLIVILVASVLSSYRKGFSREVIGLVSGVLALLLGIWFYGSAGSFLLPYVSSRAAANFAGFFLVFCGVLLLGGIVSFVVGRFLRVTGLSIVDHALGAGFGLLRGIVVAVALIMGIMAFSPGEGPPSSVVNSRLSPYVASAARVCAAVAPKELKDGFWKTYAELKTAWQKALDKGIRSVPGTAKEKDERKI